MKQMDACHGPSLWEEVVIAKRWNRLVNKIMRDDDTGTLPGPLPVLHERFLAVLDSNEVLTVEMEAYDSAAH